MQCLRTFIFGVLICSTLPGCARTPLLEQLVSKGESLELSKQTGSCLEEGILDPVPEESSCCQLPADDLKILSWNIYKENSQHWDTDLRRLSKDTDIVFLQEASLTEELREVLRENRLFWTLNSAFRYSNKDTGVMIASPARPIGSCGLRLDEPIIGLPKAILIQKYRFSQSNSELLVANIHGINITTGTESYQQQIDAMKDIFAQHTGPIIFAGDFNNWSKERTRIIMEFAEEFSLQLLEFTKDERTLFWGEPVDQIFYRGLQLLSQSVLPVTSSDHNPIRAIFAVPTTMTTVSNTNTE